MFAKPEHRPTLSSGAFGDAEKLNELSIRSSLKTFGDTIRDRNRRPLELILGIPETAKFGCGGEFECLQSKLDRCFPYGQFFEVGVFHTLCSLASVVLDTKSRLPSLKGT